MSTQALFLTAPAVLDANGNATAFLKPSTGEYWVPKLIRVTTNSQISPLPHCTVYHGAVSSLTLTSYIDDTATGNNDASSIIAGSIVRFGEAISAQWTGGNPGDVATLTIYGVISDTLPAGVDLVSTPGTHFAGKLTTEIIGLIDKTTGGGLINPNGGINTSDLGRYIDVRQWASYNLKVSAITASSPATQFNGIEVNISWANDVNGTDIIYTDTYEFFADNQNGPVVALGDVHIQDIMHGPYILLLFRNNSTADTVSLQWRLFGTTRTIAEPFVRQDVGEDAILLNTATKTIPANGTITTVAPLGYGRAYQKLVTGSPGQVTFNIGYGSTGVSEIIVLPASTTDRREYIIPKRALKYDGVAGGTGGSYNIVLIRQFDSV